jgi:hypothetical protein
VCVEDSLLFILVSERKRRTLYPLHSILYSALSPFTSTIFTPSSRPPFIFIRGCDDPLQRRIKAILCRTKKVKRKERREIAEVRGRACTFTLADSHEAESIFIFYLTMFNNYTEVSLVSCESGDALFSKLSTLGISHTHNIQRGTNTPG